MITSLFHSFIHPSLLENVSFLAVSSLSISSSLAHLIPMLFIQRWYYVCVDRIKTTKRKMERSEKKFISEILIFGVLVCWCCCMCAYNCDAKVCSRKEREMDKIKFQMDLSLKIQWYFFFWKKKQIPANQWWCALFEW